MVPCYDPSTMQLLGHLPAMSAAEVRSTAVRMLPGLASSGGRGGGCHPSTTINFN